MPIPGPLPHVSSPWPALKFVDAPDPSAVVRLDLNDGGDISVLADGFSLGAPKFEGAPNQVGVDYGYRELSLTVRVTGPKATALLTLQALAREAMRRTNWLLVQLQSTSTPVWYKTYRGQPGELSLAQVYDETAANVIADQWAISVPLVAEAFSYGARVSQPVQSIINDPAVTPRGCFAQLPTILGDAPAPARVRVRYINSDSQSGRRHMLAVSPAPATYTAPIVWPVGGADGWTAGTDTGTSASGATTMSGGNYRAVSFATTTTMANRLTGAAPSPVPPGQYKVLVRVGRSDQASTFSFSFGSKVGFLFFYGKTVNATWPPTTAGQYAAWVDLGDFTFPTGAVLDDLSGEPSVTPNVALRVARLSGTGAAWLDSFMLVPVGDEFSRTMFVSYPNLGPSALTPNDEYHDGDEEAVYCRDAPTGQLTSLYPPEISGGFPVVVPGANNVLHFVEQTSLDRSQYNGTADVPDRLGVEEQVLVSYNPRYLNLAP